MHFLLGCFVLFATQLVILQGQSIIIIIKSLIEKDSCYNYCDKETPRTLKTLIWKKLLLFHQKKVILLISFCHFLLNFGIRNKVSEHPRCYIVEG